MRRPWQTTTLAAILAAITAGCANSAPRRALLLEESGPAGPGGRPMWVASPMMHPAAAHGPVALGSGTTPHQADEAALVNLAREIASETAYRRADAADYRRWMAAVGEDPSNTAELLELQRIERLIPLAGADIVGRWSEQPPTWFYSIAGVDHGRLAAAYKTEMQMNANAAQRQAARAQSEPDPLRKLAHAQAAILATEAIATLAAARDRLIGEGQLEEPASAVGPVQAPSISIPELEAIIAATQNAAAIAVLDAGQDPVPPPVDTELKEAVSRLRVPVVPPAIEVQLPPESRHACLLAKYAVDPVQEPSSGRTLASWTLTIQACRAASESPVDTLAINGTTGGRTYADAQLEAAREARRQLHARIDSFLDRTLLAATTSNP
jgi:hypothetical protein